MVSPFRPICLHCCNEFMTNFQSGEYQTILRNACREFYFLPLHAWKVRPRGASHFYDHVGWIATAVRSVHYYRRRLKGRDRGLAGVFKNVTGRYGHVGVQFSWNSVGLPRRFYL